MSNTIFSFAYPGYDLSISPLAAEADIINIHWVARYQSPWTLNKLLCLGKPVIWTLHDMWPFTGGCHYSGGCEKYREDCTDCPQLKEDGFGLPAAILKDKENLFKGKDLTIVAPSRWMAGCAAKSWLFKDLRIEVIPNSLETDVFSPKEKAVARKELGLDPEAVMLLFGGENASEERKGFKELVGAVKYCFEDPRFQELIRTKKALAICFGRPSGELHDADIPFVSLGYLDSDEKISTVYSAADLFILPSLEDNFPNTMLEAMSCGTPVVAFQVGGIPDVVEDRVTGQLVPLGDVRQMAEAILVLALNPELRSAMGEQCRQVMQEKFSLELQAERYLALYRELSPHVATSVGGGPGCGMDERWQIKDRDLSQPLLIPLDLGMGSNAEAVFDPVLLKSLQEMVPLLQTQLNESNEDREARLVALRGYEEQLRWYDTQLKEAQRQLDESNVDREARLKALKKYEKDFRWYERQLEASQREMVAIGREREAHLDAILKYQTQLEEAHKKLEEISAERDSYLEISSAYQDRLRTMEADHRHTVEMLQERIAHLSSTGKALRIVIKRIVYHSFSRSFFDRYYHFFDHVYGRMLNAFSGWNRKRLESAQEMVPSVSSPSEEAVVDARGLEGGVKDLSPKSAQEIMPSVNSPLVEAFVNARGLEGGIDDLSLEFFYKIGESHKRILCVYPSVRTVQALYMALKGGARIDCISKDKRISKRLIALGIDPVMTELGVWISGVCSNPLNEYEVLILDGLIDEADLLMFKGRLLESNEIIFTNFEPGRNPTLGSLEGEGRMDAGVFILGIPPEDWLNPVARAGYSDAVAGSWPWSPGDLQLPTLMPSGRPWPKITVVTVTLNQGPYLEETLRSVVSQGYPNLEYIVIDGGSTDNTSAILKRYHGELAHCVSEKDQGQADALNKGFRLATGDILAWLNSDDLYLPETLIRVALAFDAYNVDMVAGDCGLIQGSEKTPFRIHRNALPFGRPDYLPFHQLLDIDGSWQKGEFFYQPEVFWTRDIWVKSGSRVDPFLFYSMDYDLWARMAKARAKIVHTPDVLALFRMHENQKTSGENLPFLDELRRVNAEFRKGLR